VIALAPAAILTPGDIFQVNWTGANAVRDLSGNDITGNAFTFTTGTAPVNTPPAVVSSLPSSGFTNVGTNVVPRITFDRPLNGSKLSGVTLKAGANAVNIVASLSNANRTITLMPPNLLAPSTVYTITVAGIVDVAGNALAAPVTITFTTGPGADLQPPQIVSSSPVANDNNVSSGLTTVTVTFNEPIDPASLAGPNSVNGLSGPVPANLSLSADGLTLTFTLNAPLSPNTSYNIGIYLADLAGNYIASTSIPFTTGN